MRSSATTSAISRTSSAICCSRSCSTRAWRRRPARSRSPTSRARSATRCCAAIRTCSATRRSRAARSRRSAGKRSSARSVRPHAAAAGAGVLDDVPVGLPALTRATKLGKRAASVGFDWPDVAGVRAKVDEELAELDAAAAQRRRDRDRRRDGRSAVLRSRTGAGISSSIPRPACAPRTRNSRRGSAPSSTQSRATAAPGRSMTRPQLDAVFGEAREGRGALIRKRRCSGFFSHSGSIQRHRS